MRDSERKENILNELSLVNLNIQLLREEMAEQGNSLENFQGIEEELLLPMIPVRLKETKETRMEIVLKKILESHYFEDSSNYEDLLSQLTNLREATRTPTRDSQGISFLFQYYNQLNFVEKRFFPSDNCTELNFTW